MNKAQESVFQDDIIRQMVANGWQLDSPAGYNRELALYTEDVLGFVQDTQDAEWQKYCKLYPQNPEQHFLERVASQLNKADPNAANRDLRTFGTLGVLRHELRDRGTRFKLCQFKPEHDLNPDTLRRYHHNRLRIVPELVYSPYASEAHLAETGNKAKVWRIDLVLFVNGLPIATLELKSEFKQAVENAIKQYKRTRLSKDPATNKPEPLLSFKRGALVHFAVSQYEVYMATRLAGDDTFFLPFNKGTQEGGAGNDVKKDLGSFTRFYEFMSQIVQYDNKDLENLSLYARHLRPMLREKVTDEDDIDLSNVTLSHYRLSKMRQQVLNLREDAAEYKLEPGSDLGSAKDIKEEWLSQILTRLNDLFVTDHLTAKDMINYAYTIRDKVSENEQVMQQLKNSTPEQTMLGDFPKAVDDAVLDSTEAHQNQMMQVLSNPEAAKGFAKVIFDLLVSGDKVKKHNPDFDRLNDWRAAEE